MITPPPPPRDTDHLRNGLPLPWGRVAVAAAYVLALAFVALAWWPSSQVDAQLLTPDVLRFAILTLAALLILLVLAITTLDSGRHQ